MTTPLRVQAGPDAEQTGAVGAVVASLPVSFAPAGSRPDVVALAGAAGWTSNATDAVRSGARGVVVIDPVAEDPAALAAAAAEAGTAVVLDQAWAGNPALADSGGAVRAAIADALADAVLLDSVAWGTPGTDPEVLLTRHLAAILACGVELSGLRIIQRNANGYTVIGTLPGGAPTALQGITTSSVPATATVSVLTSSGRADITLPDASAGWPAEVPSVTPAGTATFPTIYESAHRHSWRRLRAAVDSGAPAADLEQFAALAALVGQLHDSPH
ncbi:hypothetical protein [Arthrobacter sp. NicSoilB8]|uniref:hypothetical protein n=1 Tax=Arthrobacter sp. NicSoilB8 TaxID=2830998 RepID=UPI001CC50271|nr:hypothetical protein [Arthrobacter sp. NicSoilB8]BCW69528.1 hypothetical protein NicSoilB8_05720 [Arthrobacter sp. NicSoilB8]